MRGVALGEALGVVVEGGLRLAPKEGEALGEPLGEGRGEAVGGGVALGWGETDPPPSLPMGCAALGEGEKDWDGVSVSALGEGEKERDWECVEKSEMDCVEVVEVLREGDPVGLMEGHPEKVPELEAPPDRVIVALFVAKGSVVGLPVGEAPVEMVCVAEEVAVAEEEAALRVPLLVSLKVGVELSEGEGAGVTVVVALPLLLGTMEGVEAERVLVGLSLAVEVLEMLCVGEKLREVDLVKEVVGDELGEGWLMVGGVEELCVCVVDSVAEVQAVVAGVADKQLLALQL
jgi:hypothetical protein